MKDIIILTVGVVLLVIADHFDRLLFFKRYEKLVSRMDAIINTLESLAVERKL